MELLVDENFVLRRLGFLQVLAGYHYIELDLRFAILFMVRAFHSLKVIPSEIARLAAECLRDKSVHKIVGQDGVPWNSVIHKDRLPLAKTGEEQFRKFCLNIPHPKEDTLSRHSILGTNGLHAWTPEGTQYTLKLRKKSESLKNQENMMMEAKQVKALDVQSLENEHELLKADMEMALDQKHSVGFYNEKLNEQVEAKSQSLTELESQWNYLKQTLDPRHMREEQSLYAKKSSVQEKLIKLKEIEQETDANISEIWKREDEHGKLLLELEKLPKDSSKKSNIQRMTEITKNS